MGVSVLVGMQWGDEGKGKITDILSKSADLVVRYQGGNNAGHTVVVDDDTYQLHLLPSGVLYPNTCCVLGNGMVIDPRALLEEITMLVDRSVAVSPDNLKISSLAHVIFPFHHQRDRSSETLRSTDSIGTTQRGIGPAYVDKVSRIGIRMIDLASKQRLANHLKSAYFQFAYVHGRDGTTIDMEDIDTTIDRYHRYGQALAKFIIDTSLFVNDAINLKKTVLLEGAQGTMLDIDHGTYPFVTSSNPIAGGACVGIGVGPNKIETILGIAKAYTTRVGQGPFPTELTGDVGGHLQQRGSEFGTTTNRPRRCGWLDLVMLKYAIRLNGITQVCLTKLDVLDDLDRIPVCTHYQMGDQVYHHFPLDADRLAATKPIYEYVSGWKTDISCITSFDDLPEHAKKYVWFIEIFLGVNISMISVGSRRNQTIRLLSKI